ncbi:MAG: ABC transporter permease [Elusimicrobia bacterium]|nr:ABC transporter permease [Elusimicrobiota bacterium]
MINLAVPLMAVLFSLAVGALFILITGKNPFFVYSILFSGIFGNLYGIGQLFFYATPLIFTGLAVAFAFKAGLFNIGCEGQLYMGSLLCAWTGCVFSGLPGLLLIPVCLAAAAAGGAAWGFIPGMLKAKTGAHEVITTIMLNFIALAFTNYIVTSHFFVPGTVRTPQIAAAARLPAIAGILPGFKGSSLNFSFFIALAAALAVWYILYLSRFGYELRAMGYNPAAGEYAGVDSSKMMIVTLAVSGGISGLVGSNYVMGYKYYFEQGFSGGVGFMGIAVALLGKNHPFGIIAASLLFGGLSFGSLLVNSVVPKEILDILQAVVILSVVVGNTVFSRILLRNSATGDDKPDTQRADAIIGEQVSREGLRRK